MTDLVEGLTSYPHDRKEGGLVALVLGFSGKTDWAVGAAVQLCSHMSGDHLVRV